MKNTTCLLAWTMIVLALTTLQSLAQSIYEPYTFTTLAGGADDGVGNPDGTGSAARFGYAGVVGGPDSVAVDSAGNVYAADLPNNTIRKVTPTGVVTTLAGLAGSEGSADGTGSDARFYWPTGVALDSAGNVYVADTANNTIRKVTPAGVVTTLAGLAGSSGSVDGTGGAARFNQPAGVAVDGAGNVYVADFVNNTIRKVTPTRVVTTLAGGFSGSYGVAVDTAGNVYMADPGNHTIRKVTATGVVTTLAGMDRQFDNEGNFVTGGSGSTDGTGSAARFNQPSGVAVDSEGNVYVADRGNKTIRKVTAAGVVTTLAGLVGGGGSADGTGSDARFGPPGDCGGNIPCYASGPVSLAVDAAGNVYVADSWNHTIRKGYPAPRILTSRQEFGFSGGQFGFNLTGPAGRSAIVEASADLVNWLPLWTNTYTFPAALNFSDPQSGTSSTRFYRAHLP